jgi:gliding motility-associated-like protein
VATPNGDSRNDLFFITNLNQFAANTLDIYDRHGRKVFSETNYGNTLDFSGFTAGVYYYYLTVTDKQGTQTFKGWLDVVKP